MADREAGEAEQLGGAARRTRFVATAPHPPLPGTEESRPSAKTGPKQNVPRASVSSHP